MPDKDYNLTFENRDGYLYVHLTGTESFESSLGYWAEIDTEIQKHKYGRLLVHKEMQGSVSGVEVYDIIKKVVPAAKGLKVAFFDENKIHAMINRFGQLLANNCGASIRIFASLAEAENWMSRTG